MGFERRKPMLSRQVRKWKEAHGMWVYLLMLLEVATDGSVVIRRLQLLAS